MKLKQYITITSLWILTILYNTGFAVEEHVLTLDGQEVRFTAVARDINKIKLLNTKQLAEEVSYLAPLFSVNGQKVGVTPEVVVRVTSETSRKALESICNKKGLRLLRPMPFTTHEYVLKVLGADARAVFAAVRALNKTNGIEWAWPNLIHYLAPDPVEKFEKSLSLASAMVSISDVTNSNTLMEPNDPLFPNQWHLHNTGQHGGTPGADINALAAWEITTGDPNIVVAVVDTGVDMNHPDLVSNLTVGYDFVEDDNDTNPHFDHFMDQHGTFCAGLISAQGNNGIGITGVTWNCKIMPIRITNYHSGGSSAWITETEGADAFRWAAINGADILSNSWFDSDIPPIFDSALIDVTEPGGIGRGGKGCVVFFCTGTLGSYPNFGPIRGTGAHPEVIGVGATDNYDTCLEFSGYGPELDIMAPGAPYPSFFPDWYIPGRAGAGIWTTGIWGRMDYNGGFGGTSAACPIAAGVGALILSIEPDLTSQEVRHFLTRSAKDLGEPGRDDYYGWGRVDARAALDLVLAHRADLNKDWQVDEQDLDLLQTYLDTNDLTGDIAPAVKRDGIVDANDLALLTQYLGMEIPEFGLLAHWKLDETEGNIAHNSTGDPQYNAELQGDPAWQPEGGMVGGALAFDGQDDYVTTGLVLDPSAFGPFSVFAWIKGGAPGQVILSQNNTNDWLKIGASGELASDLGSTDTRETLTSTGVVTDGQWHRIGLTWDGENRVLYVDDIEAARDTQTTLTSSDQGLNIGTGSKRETGTFWEGLIDDVKIYNWAIVP